MSKEEIEKLRKEIKEEIINEIMAERVKTTAWADFYNKEVLPVLESKNIAKKNIYDLKNAIGIIARNKFKKKLTANLTEENVSEIKDIILQIIEIL